MSTNFHTTLRRVSSTCKLTLALLKSFTLPPFIVMHQRPWSLQRSILMFSVFISGSQALGPLKFVASGWSLNLETTSKHLSSELRGTHLGLAEVDSVNMIQVKVA